MRRHLQKFLPIVLIALAVQIFAPMAAAWAAAAAASDPLRLAEICHSLPAENSGPADQGSGGQAHDETCLICCAAQAAVTVDTPLQTALPVPYRQFTRVVWTLAEWDVAPSRVGSNSQARAPPQSI